MQARDSLRAEVTVSHHRIASRSRTLLGGVALLLLLGALPLPAGPAENAAHMLVTVGSVTSTSAVVWAHRERDEPMALTLAAAEPDRRAARVQQEALAVGRDGIAKALVGGLAPGTRYEYRVSTPTASVVGRFVTAPSQTARAPVRFLWSGDLGGRGHCRRAGVGYAIFRAMARRDPAFFVFAGDTIYADNRCVGPGIVPGSEHKAETLEEFHAKHRYNREDPAVQEFFRTTAVHAIWGDHDVRNNFAAADEPLVPTGLRAFLDYWPIRPPAHDPTRLYRRVRWGALLELFILDTRQYRSPGCQADGPTKTMLGDAQRRWLIDSVATSDALWKVVVSSVPFSIPKGFPCSDTWARRNLLWRTTGFGVERDAILRELREHQVRNVVILAGDVHYADFVRLEPAPGFTLHEFTAGPLSAGLEKPRRLDAAVRPERLSAAGRLYNFGEIVIDGTALTARALDEHGRALAITTVAADFAPRAAVIE
jgi:alkaline phosphatase D